MRRLISLVAIVGLCVSACGGAQLAVGEPRCDSAAGWAVLLEFQAVPSADLVPCFHGLQEGWEVAGFEARDGKARLWFNSGLDGSRFLEILLEETCEVGDAEMVPPGRDPRLPLASDYPGTTRYIAIERFTPTKVGESGFYRGSWFFQFAGGCVTYVFNAAGSEVEGLPDQVAEWLGFVPRSVYAQQLQEDCPECSTGGAERLTHQPSP